MSTTCKEPRYKQIADVLRDQIRSGALEVGEKLPSFIDMYREYGATTATMRKVYDLLEKETLIERRSRSGIYVARSERRRTGVLGLVIPRFGYQLGPAFYMESSYAMRMLHGIHEEAASYGFKVMLCNIDELQSGDRSYDGLLVHGDLDMIDHCSNLGIPMVSLIAHLPGVTSCGVDDFEGFRSLTNFLWEQGHRRIASMIGSGNVGNDLVNPLRLQGYRAALAEHDTIAPPEWNRVLGVHPGKHRYVDWGYGEMCNWLREGWPALGCTALLAPNDAAAIGIIKALRQHGYRVPQDISVTGYDNVSDDWHFDLKLTTVDVPLDEIGRQAVSLLAAQLATPGLEARTVHLPTQIVEGESTSRNPRENL